MGAPNLAGRDFRSLATRRPWLLALVVAHSLTDQTEIIEADVAMWCQRQYRTAGSTGVELLTLGSVREFRNVLYYRMQRGNRSGRVAAALLTRLLRPVAQLDIATDRIGPGFVITHGYGTIINAQEIGANFWVHHGVTVGYDYGRGNPVIGDDVFRSGRRSAGWDPCR